MKIRIKLFTTTVLMIFSSVSCQDYLDTSSNSIFTEESSFANLDFATKAVYGIYGGLTEPGLYNSGTYFFFKTGSDIEHPGRNDNDIYYIGNYNSTSINSALAGPWGLLYKTIERANICIENLPKSPIWGGEYAKEAKRLYGEAVTLRAVCYYELITNWGDVPFSTAPVQAGDDFYLPKTDRDEIYEYLIQDLKEVEDYVPWFREIGTAERVTKGFVKGLRARMALSYAGFSLRNKTLETKRGRNWQEYYKIANEECREVMEAGMHQLNPDYENIFRTIHAYGQDQANGEVLFELAFGRNVSGRVAQWIGMAFYTPNGGEPKYGRAAAEMKSNMYYYYSFDPTDTRRNVNIELYNYNTGGTYLSRQRLITNSTFTVCKWRRSWIVPSMGGALADRQNTGVNWPMMRYSDIVLMFAESENELNGPTAAAKQALADVRQRAFPTEQWDKKVHHYVDSVAAGKEEFFNALVNERAWEFGGEMIRKQDLVRWNLLYDKIHEMKDECVKIMSNDPKYNWVPDYLFWRYKADDPEVLEILNPDYRLPSTAIPGYERTTWFPASSASAIATYTNSYLSMIAIGLDKTKNNHLYPLPESLITASRGVLTNDQMP